MNLIISKSLLLLCLTREKVIWLDKSSNQQGNERYYGNVGAESSTNLSRSSGIPEFLDQFVDIAWLPLGVGKDGSNTIVELLESTFFLMTSLSMIPSAKNKNYNV